MRGSVPIGHVWKILLSAGSVFLLLAGRLWADDAVASEARVKVIQNELAATEQALYDAFERHRDEDGDDPEVHKLVAAAPNDVCRPSPRWWQSPMLNQRLPQRSRGSTGCLINRAGKYRLVLRTHWRS